MQLNKAKLFRLEHFTSDTDKPYTDILTSISALETHFKQTCAFTVQVFACLNEVFSPQKVLLTNSPDNLKWTCAALLDQHDDLPFTAIIARYAWVADQKFVFLASRLSF